MSADVTDPRGAERFVRATFDRYGRIDVLVNNVGGSRRGEKEELPLGRFGRPEEVAAVVVFLASERASLMTGACVTVDGCQSRSLI